jgi:hypothetical protein
MEEGRKEGRNEERKERRMEWYDGGRDRKKVLEEKEIRILKE